MVRFVGLSPTAAVAAVLRFWCCPVLVSEGRTRLRIPKVLRLSAAAAAAVPANGAAIAALIAAAAASPAAPAAISAPAAGPAAIAAAAARTPQVDVRPPRNQLLLLLQSTAPAREVGGADGKPLLLLETKHDHLLLGSYPCGSNHHSVWRVGFVPVLLLLLPLGRYG